MLQSHINAAKAAAFQFTERTLARSAPAFTITRSRGFLPREAQLVLSSFRPLTDYTFY